MTNPKADSLREALDHLATFFEKAPWALNERNTDGVLHGCSPLTYGDLAALAAQQSPAPVCDGGEAVPDRDGMDGTGRLCRALYRRTASAKDYLGGSDARMLHDAADAILAVTPGERSSQEAVAWVVLSTDADQVRIWWRDKERAIVWAEQHDRPLIPLYAKPFASSDFLALSTPPVVAGADRAAELKQILSICEDNAPDFCNHKMALDFVRQVAARAIVDAKGADRAAVIEGPPTVHEYVSDYEYRGDQDHVPTDDERAMLEDAIEGYLATCHSAKEAGF
jgi:hypothetical protein